MSVAAIISLLPILVLVINDVLPLLMVYVCMLYVKLSWEQN